MFSLKKQNLFPADHNVEECNVYNVSYLYHYVLIMYSNFNVIYKVLRFYTMVLRFLKLFFHPIRREKYPYNVKTDKVVLNLIGCYIVEIDEYDEVVIL